MDIYNWLYVYLRKSPVVDGRVKRDMEGLEVRYPVILSSKEKDIARKIVKAFGQIGTPYIHTYIHTYLHTYIHTARYKYMHTYI
jgi:hypothetical protein